MSNPAPFAAPETLFTIAGTTVCADQSAPLHLGAVFALCWTLVGQRYPRLRLLSRLRLAALWTALFEGAYFVHSLGHILSSHAIGAPMDALVLTAVQQVNVYHNDGVPVHAHLARAAGGPLASFGMMLLARAVRRLLPRGPFSRDLADAFLSFNILIGGVSLAPIPSVDGGSLLKWAVYNETGNLAEASRTVREAGMNAALLSSLISIGAILFGRRLTGAAMGVFSFVTALDSLRRD